VAIDEEATVANGKSNGKNGKKNGNGGRPTRYQGDYPDLAFRFCLLKKDATDEDLASLFDVNVDTIYRWKNVHPEFSEAINEGKERADTRVAGAMFNNACGAEWVEEQAIKVKTVTYDNGKRVKEEEHVEVVEVKRRAAPNVVAGIFWLKNRQGWKDRVDHGIDDESLEGLARVMGVKPEDLPE